MDDLKNELLTVEVPIETLKKYCLWSIIKFYKDENHLQQNSSKNDLLGGFMDRWINRIPESLIFEKLLESEEFDVVNDDFFYIDESAKNAPDIIGLVKEKKGLYSFYPFYTFDITHWSKFDEDAPFIEMKTSRSSQKLATINRRKDSKIDEDFFVLVESNINKNYFLYLLNQNIFKNHYDFVSSPVFLKDENSINMPSEVINQELNKLYEEGILFEDENNITVGDYKLCGIFKGSTITKFASLVGLDENDNPICPRYLKDIVPIGDYDDYYHESFKYDYFSDGIKCLPLLIDISDDSFVFIEDYDDNNVIIRVYGEVNISDISSEKSKQIKDGYYKLKFENFIYNLHKYYYLDDLINLKEFSKNYFESKRIKLSSGLFCFYGKIFKNNKFDLKLFLNAGFEIYKVSGSSIDCYCKNDVNYCGKSFKEYFRLKFKNNGNFDKNKSKNINNSKKNMILYNYEEDKEFHLLLNFEIFNNSKVRFINKTTKYFTVCVDGIVELSDFNKHKFTLQDNFYKIEFNKSGLISKLIDKNPFIKDNELILNENNFFIPDNVDVNIKSRFDISEDSKIFIINKNVNESNQVSSLDIIIDGNARIDGYEINDESSNIYKRSWRLIFDSFVRTMNGEEYVLSKSAIISSNESCEDQLIEIFRKYIDKLDK